MLQVVPVMLFPSRLSLSISSTLPGNYSPWDALESGFGDGAHPGRHILSWDAIA
jgi:hypothetical protein